MIPTPPPPINWMIDNMRKDLSSDQKNIVVHGQDSVHNRIGRQNFDNDLEILKDKDPEKLNNIIFKVSFNKLFLNNY